MGFAEGTTWAMWSGRPTPGPAVGKTGKHNRVDFFFWGGEEEIRGRSENLRLEWAKYALGNKEKC